MIARQFRFLCNKTAGGHLITARIQQNLDKSINYSQSVQPVPIQIDVPWGKVDGKLWGDCNKQPILAIHGWMDNAGTFDLIAPQLTKNSSILAIDLPGHGLSSWLPLGVPYYQDILTYTMRYIVKDFGWNKVKLIGHSMGGILCFSYARMYPSEVQFVAQIDSLGPFTHPIIKHSRDRAVAIDRLLKFEKVMSDNPPSYPEETVIQKWIEATAFKSLDVPSTKILMIRGTKKKPDGSYYYTRDFRLSIRGFYSHYSSEEIREMAKLITCPYLVMRASGTKYEKTRSDYWDCAEDMKQNNKDFHLVDVEGLHHFHLTNPEVAVKEMKPFLEKYDV